jgi:hypothetical protein
MNDGRVIIDNKPEPLECLDFSLLKRVVLKAAGGWLSPSEAGSVGSWSDCAAGSRGVDTTVDEVGAGSMGGVVSRATSDTIDLTLK